MNQLVQSFAELMSAKFEQEQATKGDQWKALGAWELLRRLEIEKVELSIAIRAWSLLRWAPSHPPFDDEVEKVVAECVDVAIFGMFIAATVEMDRASLESTLPNAVPDSGGNAGALEGGHSSGDRGLSGSTPEHDLPESS